MHASPPLIKITDFGLSRFISPSSPLLHTRCGSEAYAAPELIINSSAGYDARETDSWACGVCLYELSCRTLPFGSDDEGISNRRKWLFRIALGEFTWPESAENVCIPDDEERMGSTLSSSPDVRRVVARLLVRDAKKRAAIGDLWDDPWISDSRHELASDSGHSTASSLEVRSTLHQEMMARTTSSLSEDAKPVPDIMANGVEDDGLDEDTEEWIVDVPEKDSISRQELT
jgi:serine/threonine protein kinase